MSAPQRPGPYRSSAFKGLIGAARVDITPPIGIYARSWGAAKHDVAEGIHRPMELSAMALQESTDSDPLVLVSLDLGWWKDAPDERKFRDFVLQSLSLAPERLMVCLTHTHAGPAVAVSDAAKPGGHLIAGYAERLREAAVFAIKQALAVTRPAILEWTTGHCTLAQNRDLPDPDRSGKDARVVCGYANAAPADTTVLVGRATGDDGRILATIVNYACHPVTLAWDNKLISPDYVGAMREVIEGVTGGAPCLFLQGASGELAPREQYTGDVAIAEKNGRQLGHAVVSALESLLPAGSELSYKGVVESGAPLATWERKPRAVSTTLKASCTDIDMTLVEMPQMAELEKQLAACTDRVMGERIRRKMGVRQAVGDGKTTPLPLWLWQIGDALLVAEPNEAYSQFQIAVRQKFPDRAVAVMNLVNGSLGYLPPRELYSQNIYQVWQSPFAAGGLEKLLDATVTGLERLIRPS